jgi:signal transduction histidine kinase
VRDDGAGIPADRLAKVFEKGESDPDKAIGAGLGLAIAKTFVEGHGGIITVDSVEGAGTTFRLRCRADRKKTGTFGLRQTCSKPDNRAACSGVH